VEPPKPDQAGLIDPADLRAAYEGDGLPESALAADPFTQFARWFTEAVEAGLPEPNAMVLSTASADGEPSARTVLLKGHGSDGFRFFTNHTSRKGQDLLANPRASLVFPWHPMRRQVVVAGSVERLPEDESAAYFHSRPYGSQLGAWASEHQSSVIGSREELEGRFARLSQKWPEPGPVPLPGFWGGYRLVPATVEFWQGGHDRLHDRLRYRRTDSEWLIERLSP
jgi:pyridoxamine 5'-phosphate oxidase